MKKKNPLYERQEHKLIFFRTFLSESFISNIASQIFDDPRHYGLTRYEFVHPDLDTSAIKRNFDVGFRLCRTTKEIK